MIHFILTKGDLTPQYRYSIDTARIHGEPIVVWHLDRKAPEVDSDIGTDRLFLADADKHHPSHVKDVLMWYVLHMYGGMYLDMDTISIKPAMDLLGPHELAISQGCARPIEGSPFNVDVALARKGSSLALELHEMAKERLVPDMKWGDTGPTMVMDFIARHSTAIPDPEGPQARGDTVVELDEGIGIIPYPVACGWEGSYIWKFYCGQETPGPEVRIISLFAQAYPEFFRGDPYAWYQTHPDFVHCRVNPNPNAALLAPLCRV